MTPSLPIIAEMFTYKQQSIRIITPKTLYPLYEASVFYLAVPHGGEVFFGRKRMPKNEGTVLKNGAMFNQKKALRLRRLVKNGKRKRAKHEEG
jgi:hypothetical protein